MRVANIYVKNILAGQLRELSQYDYEFIYREDYNGLPVSLTMPIAIKRHPFKFFPAFFEGLLPEGIQLEALLRDKKINRHDYFGQLLACGADCVGTVSVKELK